MRDGGREATTHARRRQRNAPPTHVPLDAAQILAVVGLSSTTSGAWCSGTLIAERTVLTANHCVFGEPNLWVLFGEDDYVPELAVPVIARVEHPTRDTALLELAFDPATQIPVRPIPIFGGTLTSTSIGSIVEQAGYGDTQSAAHGRFFVTERFRRARSLHVHRRHGTPRCLFR